MNQELSNVPVSNVTVGFIYWLQEHHDMRGLKDLDITKFPAKLKELQQEYNSKYPQGLTGWSTSASV